jgi:hypothetical protein
MPINIRCVAAAKLISIERMYHYLDCNINERKNIVKVLRNSVSLLVAAALGMAVATSAMAADPAPVATPTSKAEYKQALAGAKADYKAAYAACVEPGRLKCRRDARASLDKANADAREAHGMPRFAPGPRN